MTLHHFKLVALVAAAIFFLCQPTTVTYTAAPIAYAAQKVEPRPLETPPPTILKSTVTGYSAEPGQTDDTPNITANGDEVYSGGIACPAALSFGTQVRISNVVYTCNDRMASRFRDESYYDIFFFSTAAAIAFGRQQLSVEVLQ